MTGPAWPAINGVGVDGCRAGWVAAWPDAGRVRFGFYETFEALLVAQAEAERVCIDIPIGLLDGPGQRACDVQARQLLGARRSSVFAPPGRAALGAKTYDEANALNKAQVGRGLSLQSYHLLPKIRQVDRCLRRQHQWQSRVMECHPELVFCLLQADGVLHRKTTPAGYAERLAQVERWQSGASTDADAFLSLRRRSEVKPDDVADALACMLVACGADLQSLPNEDQRDAVGLPMRMVCVDAHGRLSF